MTFGLKSTKHFLLIHNLHEFHPFLLQFRDCNLAQQVWELLKPDLIYSPTWKLTDPGDWIQHNLKMTGDSQYKIVAKNVLHKSP